MLTPEEILASIRGETKEEFLDLEEEFDPLAEAPPPTTPEAILASIRKPKGLGIEGFTERSGTLSENALADFVDMKDAYVHIAESVAEDPLGTVSTMAKNLVPAFIQTYKRWGEAASQGKLIEAIYAHPVEFIQDWSFITSLTGGATGAIARAAQRTAGVGARWAKVAKAIESLSGKVEKVSDAAQFISDPIGGTAGIAATKVISGIVGTATEVAIENGMLEAIGLHQKRPKPKPSEIIYEEGSVADVSFDQKLPKMSEIVKQEVVYSNYPFIEAARKAEAIKRGIPLEKAKTIVDTKLGNKVRTFTGIRGHIEATLDKGFRDPNDLTKTLLPEDLRSQGVKQIISDHGVKGLTEYSEYEVARRVKLDLHDGRIARKQAKLEEGSTKLQELNDQLIRSDMPIEINNKIYDSLKKVQESINPENITALNKSVKEILDDPNLEIKYGNIAKIAEEAATSLNEHLNITPLTAGLDMNKLDAIIRKFDPEYNKNNPDFNPDVHNTWEKMQRMRRERLLYMEKGGRISPELRAKLELENPNYVRFQRANKLKVDLTPEQQKKLGVESNFIEVPVADGKVSYNSLSATIRSTPEIIKKIQESEKRIKNTVLSDMLFTGEVVNNVMLNNIWKETSALANYEGSGIRRLDSKSPEVLDSLNKINEKLDTYDDVEGLLKDMELPNNIVRYYDNGEAKYLAVDDVMLAQAVASLRPKPNSEIGKLLEAKSPANKVLKFAQFVPKILRSGITLSPSFSLGFNIFRDTFSAGSNSRFGFKPVYDTFKGFSNYFNHPEMVDMWAISGGMQSEISAIDRRSLNKDLEKYLSPENTGYLNKIKENFKSPLEFMRLLQRLSEAGTRLGEFELGLKKELGFQKGKETIEQALERNRKQGVDVEAVMEKISTASRDISTDFGMQPGNELMRGWMALAPFQGAQVKSIDLLRRKLLEGTPKERAAFAARSALFITLPTLMSRLMLADDDEFQNDVPDVEKRLFLHFRVPENSPIFPNQLIRTPKPYEVGLIFGTLPEMMFKAYAEDRPELYAEMAKKITSDFQPFSLPTVLKAPMEIYSDYDYFFDAPITPRGQQNFSKANQFTANTSEFAKIMSKWSEYATSWMPTKHGLPPEALLSPIQIDALLRKTTGTLGIEATKIVDKIAPSDIPKVDPLGGMLETIPILNRFASNVSKYSQVVSDFYEVAEGLEKTYNTALDPKNPNYKLLMKDPNAPVSPYNVDRELVSIIKSFRKTKRELYKLNAKKKKVELSKKINGSTKREYILKINAEKRNITKRKLDEYRDYLKKRGR